jgi:peptide/nickel transport system substrate-binding protein
LGLLHGKHLKKPKGETQFLEENMKPRSIRATLLVLILMVVVACGTAEAPEPTASPPADPTATSAEGGTSQPTATPQVAAPPADVEGNPGNLTVMVGDLATERFDPVFTSGPGTPNYVSILHGTLLATNEKTEMLPGIAEEWSLSADGLVWSFTIREGVKFHDGSEVTPEDVRWTLEHSFGPQAVEYAASGTGQRISRAMDKIEASGTNEVSVITKEPVTDFLLNIRSDAGSNWYGILPKRDTVGDTAEAVAYDNNPVGAGFMELQKHVPASVMTFERFEDFYYQPDNGFPEDKRVSFQSLDMFLVTEESTRVAALRSGEADLVPVSVASKQQVETGGGRVVFGQEGLFVEAHLIGCYKPEYPCHDKRVRHALDYAINKNLIRDQLYGGPEIFQVKGWWVVTPSTMGYTPEIDPWPFDPDKARQLMAEAGYPEGQGFGKLIVNTAPSTSMPFQVEAAQIVADMWRRELGLDVEVRVNDSTGLRELERSGQLHGQVLWQESSARPDATGKVSNAYADPESTIRIHEDPEIFTLVNETFGILEVEEKAEASTNLFLRLREESYQLGIGYANIPWGVGPRVETWDPYPLSSHPTALHTITLK